jgi:hypothetical protein
MIGVNKLIKEAVVEDYVEHMSESRRKAGRPDDDYMVAMRYSYADKLFSSGRVGVTNDVILRRIIAAANAKVSCSKHNVLMAEKAVTRVTDTLGFDGLGGPIGELLREFNRP